MLKILLQLMKYSHFTALFTITLICKKNEMLVKAHLLNVVLSRSKTQYHYLVNDVLYPEGAVTNILPIFVSYDSRVTTIIFPSRL